MTLWQLGEYGESSVAANWAMFGSSCFVVLLRIGCRVHRGGGILGFLGADDYITAVCVLVLLLSSIFATIGNNCGLGSHVETLTREQEVEALRWNVIINAITVWSFSLPKFAIAATLKRILDYGFKTSILLWGLAISCQTQILGLSIWWFKQCTPVAYQWDRSIQGSCASVRIISNWGYFVSAYSAAIDLVFALYPIPFLMRLQLPLKNRIALSVALSLSSLGFVISLYKLVILGSVFEMMPHDPTYPGAFLVALGNAEGAVLTICASLPTLGPLLRAARDALASRVRSNNFNGRTRPSRSNSGYIRTSAQQDVLGYKGVTANPFVHNSEESEAIQMERQHCRQDLGKLSR